MKITKTLLMRKVRPLVMRTIREDAEYSYLSSFRHESLEVDPEGLEGSGLVIGREQSGGSGVAFDILIARWHANSNGKLAIRMFNPSGNNVRRVMEMGI